MGSIVEISRLSVPYAFTIMRLKQNTLDNDYNVNWIKIELNEWRIAYTEERRGRNKKEH